MSEAHIATMISQFILGISKDPLIVLLVVNLLLLAVGMVFEPLPALVMFVPTCCRFRPRSASIRFTLPRWSSST